MLTRHVTRISITLYPDELEKLKKKAEENGLPLSRYLVLRALNRLVTK